MSYLDLSINHSYISYGDDNIASAFLNPVLSHTQRYRRSVGFFSSSVFIPIIDGIVDLCRNGGVIQLIASPNLSEDDIAAIKLSDYDNANLLTLIDTRILEEKAMIFTGNLHPKDLYEHLGDRLASRICSGTLVNIKGKDQRGE